MFEEHSLGLAQNGMAPAVVTWEGLAAWCGLTGVVLAPWEARALVTLGIKRASIEGERMARDNKQRPAAQS